MTTLSVTIADEKKQRKRPTFNPQNPNHVFAAGKKVFSYDGRVEQKSVAEQLGFPTGMTTGNPANTGQGPTPVTGSLLHATDSSGSWLANAPKPAFSPSLAGVAPPQPKVDLARIKQENQDPKPSKDVKPNLIGRPSTGIFVKPRQVPSIIQIGQIDLPHRTGVNNPITLPGPSTGVVARKVNAVTIHPDELAGTLSQLRVAPKTLPMDWEFNLPRGQQKLTVGSERRGVKRAYLKPYTQANIAYNNRKEALREQVWNRKQNYGSYREPAAQSLRDEVREMIEDGGFTYRANQPVRNGRARPPAIRQNQFRLPGPRGGVLR